VRATGSEKFETMQTGAPHTEAPEPGEVIWRDEQGTTCRRWNWRQCARTRIEITTTNMWFVLEALNPMPDTALMEAGTVLIRGLRMLSPQSSVEACLLESGGSTALSPNFFI
jgi:DNA/RNA-binding domain of Phe-tRNA-synthetase-like protein